MLRVVEAALMLCVTVAVLSFGGTEPVSFSIVEVLLLAAAVAALYALKNFSWSHARQIGIIPATLLALTAFQLLPIPTSLLRWLRPSHAPWNITSPENAPPTFSTLSIAPYATRTHLVLLACCTAVFFFARTLGQDRQARRRLVGWLLALGTFEALYGLLQYLSGWQKIFNYAKKYNLEEATGTYINRNHFAGFLEMVIPFGLALVLYENAKLMRGTHPVRRWKAILSAENLPRVGLRFLATAVMLAGLAFSRSRMGIVAAASSLALLAAFSGFQRKAGLWFAAVLMVCVTTLVLWMGATSTFERFGSLGQEYSAAGESRLSLWIDSARLVAGHPLLGSGLGTFPVAFTTVQTTFLGKFVNHAHNDYLEFASDLGVPAAILLFGSIAAVFVRLASKIASASVSFEKAAALGCLGAIAAILLHSLADFNLYIPANALVFSCILGLAAAICAAGPENFRTPHAA